LAKEHYPHKEGQIGEPAGDTAWAVMMVLMFSDQCLQKSCCVEIK